MLPMATMMALGVGSVQPDARSPRRAAADARGRSVGLAVGGVLLSMLTSVLGPDADGWSRSSCSASAAALVNAPIT